MVKVKMMFPSCKYAMQLPCGVDGNYIMLIIKIKLIWQEILSHATSCNNCSRTIK